ncbi:pyridoxal-5'-phosphate-dependent protein subunit beta [Amycolatopsis antarctica]|uniref:Pyridoxal-5'-phosphate-dependent protein subunit beta n=1 Tax=Amycolatopsis antarctica TaxID=1854586 RepID=A0A263CX53_9PSEU|nr:PLP-dependent cysteine synthase family protein [Amycolatopsis antarctica]OZM70671.1 pyridoxal-5'-phosphate-dependent protein subunit beta [Amycolatopsis antarctica]
MPSHDVTLPVPAPDPVAPQLAAFVGNTPVTWIDRPFTVDGRGFWAKLEGHNPGGMKDRPALHMVARARERGELEPGGLVVESTSGTLGLGLALAGIVYGHPVALVGDPGMEPIILQLLRAYGTRVDIVTEPDPVGGWQEARRQRVAEIVAENSGAFCPDQYNNPDNVEAYRPLATELAKQLEHIDTLVCSVGTGGHSAGVSRVLRQRFPRMRLIGVDTVGSTIFGQPARKRLMRGLGSSIYPGNVDYGAFDEVHWVSAAESVTTCRRLAAAQYTSGGWSVGAVALVAGWAARHEPLGARIAAIFPDGPQRYFDTVYNDEFCAEHGLLGAAMPDEPDVIDDPLHHEVTRWSRCTDVAAPAGVAR